MSEQRRIIVVREDRPWWRMRYHWTVERMDLGAPDLTDEGHAYTHGAALREAAGCCSGIGPYERTVATVTSKWRLSPHKPNGPSPLAQPLHDPQTEEDR